MAGRPLRRARAILNNPPDLEARLESLRRVADPRSGASDPERRTAQRLADQLEADLRAKGWKGPRSQGASSPMCDPSTETDPSTGYSYGPVKTTEDFIGIPAAFMPLVKRDIRMREDGGKGFGFRVGGSYMFVRARDLGTAYIGYCDEEYNWSPWRGVRDGYLLVTFPPPQMVRDNRSPRITGFYATSKYGDPESLGQFPERLELRGDGLYAGMSATQKVFDIAPSDAALLREKGTFYQLSY